MLQRQCPARLPLERANAYMIREPNAPGEPPAATRGARQEAGWPGAVRMIFAVGGLALVVSRGSTQVGLFRSFVSRNQLSGSAVAVGQ